MPANAVAPYPTPSAGAQMDARLQTAKATVATSQNTLDDFVERAKGTTQFLQLMMSNGGSCESVSSNGSRLSYRSLNSADSDHNITGSSIVNGVLSFPSSLQRIAGGSNGELDFGSSGGLSYGDSGPFKKRGFHWKPKTSF